MNEQAQTALTGGSNLTTADAEVKDLSATGTEEIVSTNALRSHPVTPGSSMELLIRLANDPHTETVDLDPPPPLPPLSPEQEHARPKAERATIEQRIEEASADEAGCAAWYARRGGMLDDNDKRMALALRTRLMRAGVPLDPDGLNAYVEELDADGFRKLFPQDDEQWIANYAKLLRRYAKVAPPRKLNAPVTPLQEQIVRVQDAQRGVGDDKALKKRVQEQRRLVCAEMLTAAHHGKVRVLLVHSIDQDGGCTCDYGRKQGHFVKHGKQMPLDAPGRCVSPGKHPHGLKWNDSAYSDLNQIERMLTARPFGPFLNWGVAIGPDDALMVVDFDGPEGIATYERLVASEELPQTVVDVTGSGGYHAFLKVPAGWDIRNSSRKIPSLPGVDIRGEGGFVACSGSLHKSGNSYRWLPGHSFAEVPIADAPVALLHAAYFASKDGHRVAPDGTTAPPDTLAGGWTPAPTAAPEATGVVDPLGIVASGLVGRISGDIGFDSKLARIGDDVAAGQAGAYDEPIFAAFCSWFGEHRKDVATIDPAPVIDVVRARVIELGPRAAGKNSWEGYKADDYLTKQAEKARAYVQQKVAQDDHGLPPDTEQDEIDDTRERSGLPPEGHRRALEYMNARYAASWFGASWVLFRMNDNPLLPTRPAELKASLSNRTVAIRRYKEVIDKETKEPTGEKKWITVETKNLYDFWWHHEGRRQYNGTEFKPFPDPAVPMNETSGVLNMWRGLVVPKVTLIKPPSDYYKTFREHLFNHAASKNPHWFAHQWSWFAQTFQEPQIKPGTAMCWRGRMGTGKTKIWEVFCALMPHNYTVAAKKNDLFADFNEHLPTCLFIVMEEAIWAGDQEAGSAWKDMITNSLICMHPKFVSRQMVDFFARFIVIGNAEWICPAPADDRRFNVFDIATDKQKDHGFFDSIDREMGIRKYDSSGNQDGLKALRDDLLATRIPTWINLWDGLRTEALLDQQDESDLLEDQWLKHCIHEEGFTYLDKDRKECFKSWDQSDPTSITNRSLYSSYEMFGSRRSHKTPKQFGKWLSNDKNGMHVIFGSSVTVYDDDDLKAEISAPQRREGRMVKPLSPAYEAQKVERHRIMKSQQKAVEGIDMSDWSNFGLGGPLPKVHP